MRKYILCPWWGWISFHDVAFGNRILLWELSQTINSINDFKYIILVNDQGAHRQYYESDFIRYPNTVVVRGFEFNHKGDKLHPHYSSYDIPNLNEIDNFTFDTNVLNIEFSTENWQYVITEPNLITQQYEKTNWRPIFDIELHDKKLDKIIQNKVKNRVGIHMRGDTPNSIWNEPDDRIDFVRERFDYFIKMGIDKFYLSTDIFSSPQQISQGGSTLNYFRNYHKGIINDFTEDAWTSDLINKDDLFWKDAFHQYDREKFLWEKRFPYEERVVDGIGGERQKNWVKKLYEEYDIIDYRDVLLEYNTYLHNFDKLRLRDIIDLFSLIYSKEFSSDVGNDVSTWSKFVYNYRQKFK